MERNPVNKRAPETSSLRHRDGGDVTVVKVFIYLNDIDSEEEMERFYPWAKATSRPRGMVRIMYLAAGRKAEYKSRVDLSLTPALANGLTSRQRRALSRLGAAG